MSPEEKDAWFHEERARRQAMRQNTPFRHRMEDEIRRFERRQKYSKTAFIGTRDNK